MNNQQEQTLRPLRQLLVRDGYEWEGTDACLLLARHFAEDGEGPSVRISVAVNSIVDLPVFEVGVVFAWDEEEQLLAKVEGLEQAVGACRAGEALIEARAKSL